MKLIQELGSIFQTENSTTKVKCAIYECPKCLERFTLRCSKVKQNKTEFCHKCAVSTHSESRTRLYYCWTDMVKRCTNPSNEHFKNYGGKGITICSDWQEFLTFKAWATANGYSDELTLDRVNIDLGYSPENCRWVTRDIQAQNKRCIQTNNTSGFRGVVWNEQNSKWRATISVNSKRISLGLFKLAEDAAKAYNDYVVENKLSHPLNNLTSSCITLEELI